MLRVRGHELRRLPGLALVRRCHDDRPRGPRRRVIKFLVGFESHHQSAVTHAEHGAVAAGLHERRRMNLAEAAPGRPAVIGVRPPDVNRQQASRNGVAQRDVPLSHRVIDPGQQHGDPSRTDATQRERPKFARLPRRRRQEWKTDGLPQDPRIHAAPKSLRPVGRILGPAHAVRQQDRTIGADQQAGKSQIMRRAGSRCTFEEQTPVGDLHVFERYS